ncbi:MAG TPA: hypothetical protein VLV86_05555, partial [Vicinamibacterales bacterium]|nr:hypothetical protein [Vicinamibacterales bacterium]
MTRFFWIATLIAPLSLPALLAYPAHPASPADAAFSAQKSRGRLFPPLNLGLLEGSDREQWNKPDQIMDALKIAEGSVVADIGAAGGWFTIRLSR